MPKAKARPKLHSSTSFSTSLRSTEVVIDTSPWMIAGLGNPGRRYERTRHNAGARSAERIAADLGVKLRPSKAPALVGDAHTSNGRMLIVRPTTFMNESGRAIGPLLRWFKISPARLILIHDEIDLVLGVLRVKLGGGMAGHHGVESVAQVIGTPDFYRVRIGVGRSENPNVEPADFVLEKMNKQAEQDLRESEGRAAKAALSIIERGLEPTMNEFNAR